MHAPLDRGLDGSNLSGCARWAAGAEAVLRRDVVRPLVAAALRGAKSAGARAGSDALAQVAGLLQQQAGGTSRNPLACVSCS